MCQKQYNVVLADADSLVRYKKEFSRIGKICFDETDVLDEFNPDYFLSSWASILRNKRGAVLLLKYGAEVVGGIGCVIDLSIYTGQPTATEVFWCVDKKHRGSPSLSLLKKFEKLAVKSGCNFIVTTLTKDLTDGLDAMYIKLGYQEKERYFYKKVVANG